ncbi:MAG TPA: GerMN domain-containing protein [Terriglobales bacterium]|nr:GerMN domain-containing protein [Terriglobales bacterium]
MIPRHLLIAVVVMFAVALGMIFYAWRMQGRAVKTEVSANAEPVGPPASGPTEQATLHVAYDDVGILRSRVVRIALPAGRQERAEELLRALLDIYLGKSSPHILGAGSEIRGVYLVDPGLAVIDLNAALANGHRSGVLVEELTIASLVASLSANIPGITRVKILVDGNERDTLAGHADLTNFYDISAVNQLVAQLQTAP